MSPQPHANSAIAPMISSARTPRSIHTASTLGGPVAVCDEPGGRSRLSTARRVTLIANGRAITTRTSQKLAIAWITQNTHNSTMPTDSAVLAVPRPKRRVTADDSSPTS